MNQDTQDFLEALLWLNNNPDSMPDLVIANATIHEFSPEFVEAVDNFLAGFRAHLEAKGYDVADLCGRMERSFGSNVLFSLSGHGVGFFDDSDSDVADLHDVLKNWAGAGRFEELEYDIERRENGKIDLGCYDPDYLKKARAKCFAVPGQKKEPSEHLIAAAPDLLASLEAVMKFWTESPEEEMPGTIFDAAFAAIRKAKGA